MDALEYEKARVRMCNTSIREVGGCAACQLYDGLKRKCRVMESIRCPADEDYCKRTVSIVEQWTKDHPIRTRKTEFLKLFPNADLSGIMPCDLDKSLKTICCHENYGCTDCKQKYWNEEISE